MSESDRRAVLKGVAVGGVVLPALAACGGAVNSPRRGSDLGGVPRGSGGRSRPGRGHPNNKLVVVTQPEAGTYKAFSATCTHMGCTVAMVRDNVIVCPCHGSEFSAEDGSVLRPPAQKPLPPVAIQVTQRRGRHPLRSRG